MQITIFSKSFKIFRYLLCTDFIHVIQLQLKEVRRPQVIEWLDLEIGIGVFTIGRSCNFGGGLDLTCQIPRCSSIARITWQSSIALMTRISPAFAGTVSYLLDQPCPAFPGRQLLFSIAS